MDGSSEDLYMQNLEEFVLDEDKIVTYKWLSKTLKVHVNQSKQLLFAFCKDKKNTVSATFLIAGKLRSTGENHIAVVGQDRIDEVKSLFESLTSEHVYSVQKAKQTPSLTTLYTANSQPVEEKESTLSRLGAIRCKDSVRRAAEELALLRITVPPPPTTNTARKPTQSEASSSKAPENASPVKAKTDVKNGKEPAGKETKGKGGLAAMFAAQNSKASTKPTTSSTTVKNNPKVNKGAGLSNFFSKVGKGEPSNSDKTEKQEQTSVETGGKEDSKDIIDKEDSAKISGSVANKREEKSDSSNKKKETPKATKQIRQKRSRTKEKKDDTKQRKRIVQKSDSSDDDMFAEDANASSREASPVPVLQAKALESDDEDVIPSTPVAESNNERARRRRKVTKDKTYMDDNGYMVTEKVTEYESYSESDSENNEAKKMKEHTAAATKDNVKESTSNQSKAPNSKQPAKKASPAKNKSPLKTKQASIMSFFKK